MQGSIGVFISQSRGENGVFLPQSAVVQGPLSPEQQKTLARILEEELAIPRDRQTIQAEEGSP